MNLTLNDFDWINETLVIRRVKRGRIQQYPLQYEVGESILRYLQFGRPRAECRNLFLTLLPPYRPVRPSSFWNIISRQIQRLGLNVKPVGPHSFRHACATELLRKGSSLTEIADFLGHRSLDSVSIYAKCDLRSLKKVATFSMAGVK
jgi:integrase